MKQPPSSVVTSIARLGLAALCGLVLALQAPAATAAALVNQAPLSGANQVVNGTDGQLLAPAESFSFAGTGEELSWWGTAGGEFSVWLFDSANLATPLLSFTPSFAGLSASDQIEIDSVATDVFRYSLNLGALAGGNYTVQIAETAIDAQGGSWYWVRGAGGDGRSFAGVTDPGGTSYDFDLALRVDGRPPTGQPLPLAPTWALLAAAALAGIGATGRQRLRRYDHPACPKPPSSCA
jgi:hypothetical protein